MCDAAQRVVVQYLMRYSVRSVACVAVQCVVCNAVQCGGAACDDVQCVVQCGMQRSVWWYSV